MDRNSNSNNYFIHEEGNIFFGLDDSNESLEIGQNITENCLENYQVLCDNGNHGICQDKPKYEQFAIKSVRLSSYKNFPSYVCQTKESLAEAGFFYSGKDDLVFCFFCGQGLRSWEPCDDPWVEHMKWAPNCTYLCNVKGHSIQQSKTNQRPTSNTQLTVAEHNATKETTTNNNSLNDTPTGVLMNTIAAESLITCGYERTLIRKAIKLYVKENGNKEFKATDIVSIIFALEDGCLDSKENDNINTTPKTSDRKQASNKDVSIASNAKSESRALLEENKQLKDQTSCKICLEETVSIVFLPCGHLCSCAQCAPALKTCPICRTIVKGTVKTFLS